MNYSTKAYVREINAGKERFESFLKKYTLDERCIDFSVENIPSEEDLVIQEKILAEIILISAGYL